MSNLQWEEVDHPDKNVEETEYENYKITIYEDSDGTWGFYLDDDETDGENGYVSRDIVIEEAIMEVDSR